MTGTCCRHFLPQAQGSSPEFSETNFRFAEVEWAPASTPTLVSIFGPPASGKSRLLSALAAAFPGSAVLQVDSLFQSQQEAEFSQSTFNQIQRDFLTLIDSAMGGLKDGQVLLVENNLPLPSTRRKLIQLSEARDIRCCFIHVQATIQECLERNSKRCAVDRVPESSLMKLYEMQMAPGRSRVAQQVLLECDGSDASVCVEFVKKMQNIPKSIAKEMEHQVTELEQQNNQREVLSRRVLAKVLDAYQPAQKQVLAPVLNRVRREVVKMNLQTNPQEFELELKNALISAAAQDRGRPL